MIVGDADDALTRLAPQPGRNWVFSPWSQEAHDVVFDANSGDFWVVSTPARLTLEILGSASLTRRDIIARICNDPFGLVDEKDAAALLDGLLAQGLIVVAPV